MLINHSGFSFLHPMTGRSLWREDNQHIPSEGGVKKRLSRKKKRNWLYISGHPMSVSKKAQLR